MKAFGEKMKQQTSSTGPCQTWGSFRSNNESNSWNNLRAKLKSKPEGILEAYPGTTLIAEIEVMNETFWPWKQGCFLALHDDQPSTECPIEAFNVPIYQEVKGK